MTDHIATADSRIDREDIHHLASTNAPRRCGGCGAPATVYDHDVGFRCGACGDYPAARRAPNTSQ